MSTQRSLDQQLETLARQVGARQVVVASKEGLLVAGTGADREALETLAAYAPSQLPARIERPRGLEARRFDVEGERFYVAMIGSRPSAEAAQALADRLQG